jgi:hypothetical protein
MVLHFKYQFYNPLQFVVGILLYVSGFGKFNRNHFEYKEEVEDVILVKVMVVLE